MSCCLLYFSGLPFLFPGPSPICMRTWCEKRQAGIERTAGTWPRCTTTALPPGWDCSLASWRALDLPCSVCSGGGQGEIQSYFDKPCCHLRCASLVFLRVRWRRTYTVGSSPVDVFFVVPDLDIQEKFNHEFKLQMSKFEGLNNPLLCQMVLLFTISKNNSSIPRGICIVTLSCMGLLDTIAWIS